jgi:hypothetical protein
MPSGGPALSPSLDALPLPSDASPSRPDLPGLRSPSSAGGPPRPGARQANPLLETIPLTIEPMDDEPRNDRTPAGRPATPRSTNGRGSGDTASARANPDDELIAPRPAPRRNNSILGRLLGIPPAPLPPARQESRNSSKPRRDSDSESDLSPDEIARRRIERQIRATLGDKLRSFDVRVTGRNVVIVAQPSRFWLRRSVRRSLETLPELQGYRSRVELTE